MKKVLCILLVVVMLFAMATCAFAVTSTDSQRGGEGDKSGGSDNTPSGNNQKTQPSNNTTPGGTKGGTSGGAGGAGGASKESAQTGYNTIVLAAAAVVLTLGAGVCFVNVRKVNG